MRTIIAVCMLGKHTGLVSDKKHYIMVIFFIKYWHVIDSIREHIIIVNYITFNNNIFVKTKRLLYK